MLSKFILGEIAIDERALYNNIMFVVGDCINVNGSTYIIIKRTFTFDKNDIKTVEYEVKDYYMEKLSNNAVDRKQLLIDNLLLNSTACPSSLGIPDSDSENCAEDCETCRSKAIINFLHGGKNNDSL